MYLKERHAYKYMCSFLTTIRNKIFLNRRCGEFKIKFQNGGKKTKYVLLKKTTTQSSKAI
jgi:hypothetical protein